MKCIVTHYLIILRCFEKERNRKSIIILDNIERFIGNDEIYNKELSDFIQDIRSICDQYRERYIDQRINTNRFSAKYQFIISMRNTTVRNHTPAEMNDFKRHTINLSNWFPVNKIIDAKLEWYKRNRISVIDKTTENHLMYILNDLGVTTRNELRGLRPKMDLIFNYNKRNIVNFLVKALENCSPEDRMNTIDSFYPLLNKNGPILPCARFGYRSVIWRFILDQLRKEKLFSEGIPSMNTYSKPTNSRRRIAEINYIWKLLTVLYKYSFNNREEQQKNSELEKYMPFLDLIASVYNEDGDFTFRFYEDGFQIDRERMARLLFYMNSYDIDANEWFQFVDIQYNTDSLNRKHLKRWEDLLKVFEAAKSEPERLKIRITTAGKAYLRLVAPTFEFISCLSGKRPLLCCLPTEEELKCIPPYNQRCMWVIRETITEIKKFIRDSQKQSNDNLLLQWDLNAEGMTYAKRLIYSSYGYLTNFGDCVSRLVDVSDETAQKNKDSLVDLIVSEADDLWRTFFPNERFG